MKNKQRIFTAVPVPVWIIFIALLAFGLTFSQVIAQQITVGSGVHFVNNVHVYGGGIVNQGTIQNGDAGIFLITENWQNDGTCTGTASSTVVFTGAATQQIGGSNITTFENLTLNNSAGFLMAKDVMVNGVLNFQNGVLTTGTNLLTIGETGTIINAGATGYVEGKLANTFAAAGAKTFPIGKDGNYRPLTLQFSALTGTSVVEAEQFETPLTGDLPENTTLMTTGRHWKLNQTGGSEMAYSITLDPTDYTPARPVVMLKQDDGAVMSVTTITPTYTNASVFNSFSEFGLGEECINPNDGGLIACEQNGCSSFDPDAITNSVLPSGNTGELDLQWQQSITGSTTGFEVIEGATGAEYDPGTVTQTTWFRRLARVTCKNDWDEAAISNTVKIGIDPLSFGGTVSPILATVCHGINSTELTLQNHFGKVEKWESSTDGISWGTFGTYTSTSITATDLTATTYFRALVKSGVCEAVNSASATITIDPLPIATAGGSATICVNSSHQVSGASAEHGTISWTHNGAGNFDNATIIDPTYTPYAGDAGNTVTMTMTVSSNNACNPATVTAVYTINFEPLAVAGILAKHPNEASVEMGATVSATFTAGIGGNGTDELQYRTHDGTDWSDWENYTSGNVISSFLKTEIEIRTRRMADFCDPSDYVTVGWDVEETSVVNVNKGFVYYFIQHAVDAASDGDTIRIGTNTYLENVNTSGKGGLTFQPGFSKGIVMVTGTFTISEGDVLQMELFGDDDYDKFIIHDMANINGASLDIKVMGTYNPEPGTRFIIFSSLDNPGKFSNPALIEANGHYFILSYEEENGTWNFVLMAVEQLFKLEINQVGNP